MRLRESQNTTPYINWEHVVGHKKEQWQQSLQLYSILIHCGLGEIHCITKENLL